MVGVSNHYTTEEKKWLMENYLKYNRKELTFQFNKIFNRDCSMGAITRYTTQFMGVKKFCWHKIPKEQIEWVREHANDDFRYNIAKQFNELFKTNITDAAMHSLGRRYNIKFNFYKTNNAITKGNKYKVGELCGHNNKEGIPMIKVGKMKYQPLTVYNWEKKNGKVPKDYKIVQLKQNNYDEKNLVCVHKSIVAMLSGGRGSYFKKGNITEAAIEIAKTKLVIKNLERVK